MPIAFFSGMVGPMELLIVLLVLLLLFGGKKLPDLAKALGRSLSEFKKGREEGEAQARTAAKDPSAAADQTKEDSPPVR